MGQNSKIQWTDHTFNPWWGCEKVSPACANCYAETWAKRTGHANLWGPGSQRRFFGEKHWNEPRKWNAAAAARGVQERVFCASMADVFERHPDVVAERHRLFDLIAETPNLIWLLLTKRPFELECNRDWHRKIGSNVMVGVTAETQWWFNKRAVKMSRMSRPYFISAEPLLGPIHFGNSIIPPRWVICGGESGPGARPMNPDWARSLRDQCLARDIPFFFKQWDGKEDGPAELDGEIWQQTPWNPTPKEAEELLS